MVGMKKTLSYPPTGFRLSPQSLQILEAYRDMIGEVSTRAALEIILRSLLRMNQLAEARRYFDGTPLELSKDQAAELVKAL
jgi:hypothetical protein